MLAIEEKMRRAWVRRLTTNAVIRSERTHLPSASTPRTDPPAADLPLRSEGPQTLKVPGHADQFKFAGKIAAIVREQRDVAVPLVLGAIGTTAVNKTVKLIHVARKYLSETPGTSLGFRVNHASGSDRDRISRLHFALSPTTEFPCDGSPSHTQSLEEMWVSSGAKSRSLGGQIAVSLQVAERAVLMAIGPPAVGKGVVGMTWARRILRKSGHDMLVIPHMTSMKLKNDTRSLMGLQFLLVRIPYVRMDYLDSDDEFDDSAANSVIDNPLKCEIV